MASNYTKLKVQVDKIRGALEKITPPQPDDEFEDLRRSCFPPFDRMDAYINGRITGDGSAQTPSEVE